MFQDFRFLVEVVLRSPNLRHNDLKRTPAPTHHTFPELAVWANRGIRS